MNAREVAGGSCEASVSVFGLSGSAFLYVAGGVFSRLLGACARLLGGGFRVLGAHL